MVATQSRTSAGSTPVGALPPGGLTVRPRRGLPGNRAVVGALLVTMAAVGVFAAYAGATKGPTTRYVVAARRLPPGQRLTAGDLRTEAVQLPASMAGHSFSDAGAIVGSVTLGPLESGELVQSANVVPGRSAQTRPEASFAVDADRAVDGSLRPGDRVDVLVTYGSGTGSTTELVVSSAQLVTVANGASNGLGSVRRQVLTIALASRGASLPLSNAARAGELTVVRTTGVGEQPDRTSYQPPPVPSDAGVTGSRTTTPPPTTSRAR